LIDAVMAYGTTARIALGAACAVLMGCSGVTAPGGPLVSGTYVLESVSGRGPATGTLMLARGGYAERRVRYTEPNGRLSKEYIATGNFALRDDGTLDLQLREMGARSDFVWKPNARFVDDRVELRHPDPADGPDVVEAYRRD
jgi:hypothetical protein